MLHGEALSEKLVAFRADPSGLVAGAGREFRRRTSHLRPEDPLPDRRWVTGLCLANVAFGVAIVFLASDLTRLILGPATALVAAIQQ